MGKPRTFPVPVTVERLDGDCHSDFDAPAGRWVEAWRDRVAFLSMSPMEKQVASQLHAGASVKFVARWAARWADPMSGRWRIRTTGGVYTVLSVANVEERNELVEIMAERTAEVAQ